MNFPVHFQIGQIHISAHLVFEIAGYMIGFRYFQYLRKNRTDVISTENRILILISAAIGALLFSRLIGFLETDEFLNGEFSWQALYASKTILGGLLGGMLAVEVCKKIIGVTTSSGDLMSKPIILAMIIGRIGCFLAGLEDGTHGIASSLPWAIDFGDGIYRHPTNLYEILFLLSLGACIILLERNFELADGARFRIFLFSYCVFRFFAEFIKPVNIIYGGLSAIQITALFGIVYYWKIIVFPLSLVNRTKNA